MLHKSTHQRDCDLCALIALYMPYKSWLVYMAALALPLLSSADGTTSSSELYVLRSSVVISDQPAGQSTPCRRQAVR